MSKQITFCGKVDILNDPFMVAHVVQFNEAYVLRILIGAHIEAVFLDQTLVV